MTLRFLEYNYFIVFYVVRAMASLKRGLSDQPDGDETLETPDIKKRRYSQAEENEGKG